MTESFDEIGIEVYISGSWVNIWPDVCHSPAPRWNRGIMSNKVTDRIGGPGYLTFDLDNSASNSAGLLGYYTPGHANCRSGWDVGLRIRVYCTYEGWTRRKYYGTILPEGIQTDPGALGNRRVHVKAGDFMAMAAKSEIRGLTVTANKRIDEAVYLVLAAMPVQPLRTEFDTGVYTFPTIFDNISTGVTTGASEFQKLATSELSNIYVKGDGYDGETLVVENKTRRTYSSNTELSKPKSSSGFMLKEDGFNLLQETGSKLYLNQVQTTDINSTYLGNDSAISYGSQVINRVKVTTYPRRTDAAATVILWQLQSEFAIPAGGTIPSMQASYRDPVTGNKINGVDMVAPIAGTHYTAGTVSGGTSQSGSLTVSVSYGSDSAMYNLINTYTGGSLYVTSLKAIGKGIYRNDPVTNVYDNTTSQAAFGIYPVDIDMRYQNSPEAGDDAADQLEFFYDIPRTVLDRGVIFANRDGKSMYMFLQLEPGTKQLFSESLSDLSLSSIINGYEAEIRDGKYIWYYPITMYVEGLV